MAEKLGVSYDELFRPTLEEIAAENEIIFLLDNLETTPSCEWFNELWSIRRSVYIIATTNNPCLNIADAEPIHVEGFDEGEALEFLEPLGSENNEEDLSELCDHFGWNIMGLSVAQDYMLKHAITVHKYLEMQCNSEAAKTVRKTELNHHDQTLYVSVRTCLEGADGDKLSDIAALSCISNDAIPEFLLSNLLSSSNPPRDVHHLENEAHLDEMHDQLRSLVRITEENGFRFFSFHSFTQYVIRDMIDEETKASLLYQLAGIFMKYISKDNRFSKENFLHRTIRAHAEIFLEEWRKRGKDDRTTIALARLSELVGFTYTQQRPPQQNKLDDYFHKARVLLHELCGVTEDNLQPIEEQIRKCPFEGSRDEESETMYGITNSDSVIAQQLFSKLAKKSSKLSSDIIEDLVFLRTVNKDDLHMFPEIIRENQTVKKKFDSSQPLSASDVSVLVENDAAYSVHQYLELYLPELYLSIIYSLGRNYFYRNRATMERPHFYINLLKLSYCLSREISKRMKQSNAVFHEFVVETNGLLYLFANDDYFDEDNKHMKKDGQVYARDLNLAINRYRQLLDDKRTFFEMGILKKTKDDAYSKEVCYRQMLTCYTSLLSLEKGDEQDKNIEDGSILCDDLLKLLGIDDYHYTEEDEEDIQKIRKKFKHMNAIAEFYLTASQEEKAIKIFAISAEHAKKYVDDDDDLSLSYLKALVSLAELLSENGKHRSSAAKDSIRHLKNYNSTERLREIQRQNAELENRIRGIQNRDLPTDIEECAFLRQEWGEIFNIN